MSDSYLRDRTGKIIGSNGSDGWVRDAVGNLVAKVDSDGITRDREGFRVGYGDQRLIELGRRLDRK
jgi:hypothetical protein